MRKEKKTLAETSKQHPDGLSHTLKRLKEELDSTSITRTQGMLMDSHVFSAPESRLKSLSETPRFVEGFRDRHLERLYNYRPDYHSDPNG